MDELKNCKLCGKLYQANELASVCPNCLENNEHDYETVRDYLYLHPHATIYEVATNLDITINKIKHFLREGRIEIIEKDNQFLTCKSCGKAIHLGWYCDDCIKQPKSENKPNLQTGSHSTNRTSSNNGTVLLDRNISNGEGKIRFITKNKK